MMNFMTIQLKINWYVQMPRKIQLTKLLQEIENLNYPLTFNEIESVI